MTGRRYLEPRELESAWEEGARVAYLGGERERGAIADRGFQYLSEWLEAQVNLEIWAARRRPPLAVVLPPEGERCELCGESHTRFSSACPGIPAGQESAGWWRRLVRLFLGEGW